MLRYALIIILLFATSADACIFSRGIERRQSRRSARREASAAARSASDCGCENCPANAPPGAPSAKADTVTTEILFGGRRVRCVNGQCQFR